MVGLYHSSKEALSAQKQFEDVIQSKGLPKERRVYSLSGGPSVNILDLMTASGLAGSKSEAKRLIAQRGVDEVLIENGEISSRIAITTIDKVVRVYKNKQLVIQVGKRKAVEVNP